MLAVMHYYELHSGRVPPAEPLLSADAARSPQQVAVELQTTTQPTDREAAVASTYAGLAALCAASPTSVGARVLSRRCTTTMALWWLPAAMVPVCSQLSQPYTLHTQLYTSQ